MQLKEIHKKFYAHFPEAVFWQIVQADPTYDAEGHPGKKGKYTQWLLHAYQKGTITTESLNECYFLLDVFHRFRQLLEEKDIMKYDTLQKLRDALDPFLDDPYANKHETSKAMRIRKIKEGAEKVYEDEDWAVFVPHTWEASRYYGKGTRWCTAYDSSDNYFNQYNSKGPLYININRRTKEKWQFHFETHTFCNAEDMSVSLDDVPLSNGLRQFYHLTASKTALVASVHTFADAITQWNANGGNEALRFGGLQGDTACIETLELPSSYTDYSQMFENCYTITTLDLSRWDVSGARNMEGMFYMCENLNFLRLDGWDMSKIREFNGMFGLCDHLNTLTLDRCHFPNTATDWDIFDCCRDLRVINMYDCDMQSVRFVLQEIVYSHLYENVTVRLTPDSDEQHAYEDITSIIRETEEIMHQQIILPSEKDVSEIQQYVENLLDADIRLHKNPLYFDKLSTGVDFQISRSLGILEKLLQSKKEMTYISHRRGPLMLTRPDIGAYQKKVDHRFRQAQALLPLLDSVAEHMPQRADEILALKQHISEIPSSSQTDIGQELKQLGLSNRWHVTIPALSRIMDRVTSNTRKGVEHLRYTAKERVGFIIALLITIFAFGFIGWVAAANPGGEYWLMGIFAYGIIRAIFSVGWETLEQKRELKGLCWIIVCVVLYMLFIVYVIRPIWEYYQSDLSRQSPQMEMNEPIYYEDFALPMELNDTVARYPAF